jgi:D-3-phosphoglycerate dehydrogenase
VDRVEVEHMGRIAERDTRLLTLSVLNGLLAGRTEEEVNLVNAPSLAEERGSRSPSGASRSRATSRT